ncbi:MAG: methyltransferase domain-containing protein [Candidatus Omnitrophota bacterium]
MNINHDKGQKILENSYIKPDEIINCPVCFCESSVLVVVRFDTGHIVRCLECGHIYLNPTLSDKALKCYYDQYYQIGDVGSLMERVDRWVMDQDGIYQYVISMIKRDSGFTGMRILDVGCGCGRFLHECRKLGASVAGIDKSPQAGYLAKKYFGLDIITKTLEESAPELILSKIQFDVISAFEILEHVKEPGKFLENLYKLLKPGGLLFLTTPNFYLFYLMGISAPAVREFPVHISFFEPATLERLLTRKGFEVMNVVTLKPMGPGDRVRQKFAKYFVNKKIWRNRFFRRIYLIKNNVFNILNMYKDNADIKNWSGEALIGVARKIER